MQMINLKNYNSEFEKEYLKIGQKLIEKMKSSQRRTIIETFNLLCGSDTVSCIKKVDELLLMKYEDISLFCNRVDLKCLKNEVCQKSTLTKKSPSLRLAFKEYHNLYRKLQTSTVRMSDGKKLKMAAGLMKSQNITVCPYCNRDYINSRSETKTGAQLDHFFPRSIFPFFSISLYNLIPSCSNCNHMKTDGIIKFSPFSKDNSSSQKVFKLDFDIKNDNLQLGQAFKILRKSDLEESVHFDHHLASNLESNFDMMGINEAYSIHQNEVFRLCNLSEIYCNSQLEEINQVVSRLGIGTKFTPFQDFNHILYGFDLHNPDFNNQPLSKLRFDILRELGVINDFTDK